MTKEQRTNLTKQRYIVFWDNYEASVAMNEMFNEYWLMEADDDELFRAPENMLTPVGKFVFERLKFARDYIGIELDENILVQVFNKAKTEFTTNKNNNEIIEF